MKNLNKKYPIFILFFTLVQFANAQFVTINDVNMRNKLMQLYPSCFNVAMQLDTTCSNVLNEDSLDISFSSISNATALKYFTQLKWLNCFFNQISSLPTMSLVLEKLILDGNEFTQISNFPSSLVSLSCNNNAISTINIQNLTQLTTLSLNNNFISNIDNIGLGVSKLYCNNNAILQLNLNTNGIEILELKENNLDTIISLPQSLKWLDVSNNSLTALTQLNENLEKLFAPNNDITFVQSLPSTLNQIVLSGNQLNSLPTIPTSVTTLDIGSNMFTNVPLFENNSLLNSLSAQNNFISNFNNLPLGVNRVDISGNFLETFPSFPNSVQTLIISNCGLNFITTLPSSIKFLDISFNSQLKCLPLFDSLNVLNFEGTDISCKYATMHINNLLPIGSELQSCSTTNSNLCYDVKEMYGFVIDDVNDDCQFVNEEIARKPIKIMMYENNNTDSLQQVFSNRNGEFSFASNYVNNIITIPTHNKPYNDNCGLFPITATLNNNNTLQQNLGVSCRDTADFGVQSVVVDSGTLQSQNYFVIRIKAGNLSRYFGLNCAQSSAGYIYVTTSGQASFAGIPDNAPVFTSFSNNTYTYFIDNFDFLSNDLLLRFKTDSVFNTSSQFCVDVAVTSQAQDLYSFNNNFNFCFKQNISQFWLASSPTVEFNDLTKPIVYTYYFKNNGSSTVKNVTLQQNLSNQLDVKSFEYLSSSAPCEISLVRNKLNVFFKNINLTSPSVSNYLSGGYFQYSVLPKPDVWFGQQIQNSMNIKFDTLAFVQSNTNTLLCTSTTQIDYPKYANTLSIFYTENELYLNSDMGQSIRVFDMLGKELRTIDIITGLNKFPSDFETGIYFLKTKTSNYKVFVK
jgi:Leucine-rich repeat (LRR) protein